MFLKNSFGVLELDLKLYMYVHMALTPLCFQALTITVSYIALQIVF